jgi:purine-nucleoside phosphorylase
VSGHNPHLHVGLLECVRVAVFGGRAHYYETGNPAAMRPALETLAALGADTLLLTNAAGSLNPDIQPGDLMLLSDHINFSGLNPLIGEATDKRFVPMTAAHDPQIRAALRAAAHTVNTPLHDGIYAWYSGPSFETPAEIRAIRQMGADAVGMSNMGAGLSDESISHDHTRAMAPIGAAKLERILRQFLRSHKTSRTSI